jgi:hypothetical protein
MTAFRIAGLDPAEFAPLFALSDAELEAREMRRVRAAADHGYPDRVTLADVPAGTELILLTREHLDLASPYRAAGPIFVSRGEQAVFENEIPEVLSRRVISLRAYDAAGMMREGLVVEGAELGGHVDRLLVDPDTAFIDAHNAGRGCFAARIERG